MIERQSVMSAFIICVSTVAASAAGNDLDICCKEGGNIAIAACTRLIASGELRGHNLATTYCNRGITWYDKGEYDRAI
jgi:hypothetical protein